MGYIEDATRLEARVKLIMAMYPDDYRERIEKLCWNLWFAWYPVRLIYGKREWRWLTFVERHVLEPVYRDVIK